TPAWLDRPRRPAATSLRYHTHTESLDLDALGLRRFGCRLRCLEGEDAILEVCCDIALLDVGTEIEAAHELAVAPLLADHLAVLFLDFFVLGFRGDGQHAVFQTDVEILLLHARE